MKRIIAISVAVYWCLFGFAGCAQKGNDMENTYQQITAQEAKRIMDTETDYVIIDARTEEEFTAGHIENAILIWTAFRNWKAQYFQTYYKYQ